MKDLLVYIRSILINLHQKNVQPVWKGSGICYHVKSKLTSEYDYTGYDYDDDALIDGTMASLFIEMGYDAHYPVENEYCRSVLERDVTDHVVADMYSTQHNQWDNYTTAPIRWRILGELIEHINKKLEVSNV